MDARQLTTNPQSRRLIDYTQQGRQASGVSCEDRRKAFAATISEGHNRSDSSRLMQSFMTSVDRNDRYFCGSNGNIFGDTLDLLKSIREFKSGNICTDSSVSCDNMISSIGGTDESELVQFYLKIPPRGSRRGRRKSDLRERFSERRRSSSPRRTSIIKLRLSDLINEEH
jgi:hypothetical protein